MKNNYLIIFNDKVTINNKIKEITEKINIDDLDIIKYSYDECDIDSLIEELNTYNFLASCKLVIYDNCSFLSKETDKNIKKLKIYLDKPSENYLILINDSLSEKKEIKELLSNVEIISASLNIQKIIKDNLNEYTVASVGITRAHVSKDKEIKLVVTGLGYIITRTNVISLKDFSKVKVNGKKETTAKLVD